MRRRIATIDDLDQRLTQLGALRERQQQEFKAELREVAHLLSPATLIRNGIEKVVGDPKLQTAAIDTAISHGAGRIGKSLLVGKSHNIIMKLAGEALHFVVANLIRNKMPSLRLKLAKNKKPA